MKYFFRAAAILALVVTFSAPAACQSAPDRAALYSAVSAVAPVNPPGVSVALAAPLDKTQWVILFQPAATDAQKAAAQSVVNSFNASSPWLQANFTIVLTSSATPALNGTYACDPSAQANITAVAVYINSTSNPGPATFTNGLSTKPWPDTSGNPHTFQSPAQFITFAQATARYVDALVAAIVTAKAGGAWNPPSNAIAIP